MIELTEEEEILLSCMLHSEAINGVCIVPPDLYDKAVALEKKLFGGSVLVTRGQDDSIPK